jgi:hypothetical protein
MLCELFLWCLEDVSRPPDTLRPQKDQPLAVLVEIHQCEAVA